MRKIRFTEQTRSKRRNETYEKDSEHTMTDDRARFYVARGQAEYSDAAAGKQKPDTASSTASREDTRTPPARPEDYDRAVEGILKKEFDLDYCVNGMSVHFKMVPDVVRTELSSRLDERQNAAAGTTNSTSKTPSAAPSTSTAKAAGDTKNEGTTEKAAAQRSTRRGAGPESNTSGTGQDLAPKASARPAADLSTSEQSKAFKNGE